MLKGEGYASKLKVYLSNSTVAKEKDNVINGKAGAPSMALSHYTVTETLDTWVLATTVDCSRDV